MKPAISIRDLSKHYYLGENQVGGYRTLRESLTEVFKGAGRRFFGRSRGTQTPGPRQIWALKDVSFDVKPGEVLGIIGRNGAGKSTLLKVLSRITKPTTGEIDIQGRVGSLLEVGTGFHPELTGRENIFLNGAILGMSRREVTGKFDEIVDFAEIGPFLDTPVKRYSSGMYTRLAFAVASHLEPEVLVVDEVLAVGDMAFQKKCLGKMGQVSRQGRTVLFVSHNMTAIKSLCTRAILVEGGKIELDGDVDEVVNRYLTAGTTMSRTGIIPETAPRQQDVPGEALFRSVQLTDLEGREVNQLYFGQPFRISAICEVVKDIRDGHFEISLSTVDGIQVTYSTTMDGGMGSRHLRKGQHEITAEFDVVLLPRDYTIDLGVHHHNGTTSDFVQRTFDFTVLRVAENHDDHYPWPRTRGLVRAAARWKHNGTAGEEANGGPAASEAGQARGSIRTRIAGQGLCPKGGPGDCESGRTEEALR
jgi:lipopolysaccharide transport system ATP-binding protein